MPLIDESDCLLLVIDVQEKLTKSIINKEKIIWHINKLVKTSQLLGIETLVSEQNPDKLGLTLESLGINRESNKYKKMSFSCYRSKEFKSKIETISKKGIVICGIETHVCVQQTCIDLISNGYKVYVIVDAVSSREMVDHEIALKRLESSGVILSTTESIIFEWCKTADRSEFKSISSIIKSKFSDN